jgi:hypothetical protein
VACAWYSVRSCIWVLHPPVKRESKLCYLTFNLTTKQTLKISEYEWQIFYASHKADLFMRRHHKQRKQTRLCFIHLMLIVYSITARINITPKYPCTSNKLNVQKGIHDCSHAMNNIWITFVRSSLDSYHIYNNEFPCINNYNKYVVPIGCLILGYYHAKKYIFKLKRNWI